jgi:hypothetical protein
MSLDNFLIWKESERERVGEEKRERRVGKFLLNFFCNFMGPKEMKRKNWLIYLVTSLFITFNTHNSTFVSPHS